MTGKWLFAFAAFVLAAILFSAVSAAQGSVVVAVTMDPGGMNSAVTTQAAVHLVCDSIFSGLVAQDFELNPVPDLATRREVSGDGKTYTLLSGEKRRISRRRAADFCRREVYI